MLRHHSLLIFLFWINLKKKTSDKGWKKKIPERQLAGFLPPGTSMASVFSCYRPDAPGRTICGWQWGRTVPFHGGFCPGLSRTCACWHPDRLSWAARAATAAVPAPWVSCHLAGCPEFCVCPSSLSFLIKEDEDARLRRTWHSPGALVYGPTLQDQTFSFCPVWIGRQQDVLRHSLVGRQP